eukprot:m.231689 g.231689  ORF g.231689 m.231689 type:complete len:78 (-) comp15222_c0_seq2:232-465(-)
MHLPNQLADHRSLLIQLLGFLALTFLVRFFLFSLFSPFDLLLRWPATPILSLFDSVSFSTLTLHFAIVCNVVLLGEN